MYFDVRYMRIYLNKYLGYVGIGKVEEICDWLISFVHIRMYFDVRYMRICLNKHLG